MAALRPNLSLNILVVAVYLFFCWLMVQIVAQYIPAGADTAFLGIKQDYIEIPFYLAAFYIHVFTAILALPAGFTQFSKTLLKKYPAIHRLNGKIYVAVIVALAAPSGFYIGLFANGGFSSRISFCLLAILWSVFTWQAYRKARTGQFRVHKAFIYRSFALTLSAITLRAWKYVVIAVFHLHPMDAYQVVAWLGWLPNIFIAEILIKKINK